MSKLSNVKAKLVRQACRGVVGGFRPPDDPFTSWFGSVHLGLPGETWPIYNDKLMMPLCQFNLSELPYTPVTLSDIAVLTVFIAPDDIPDGASNGYGWLIRTYSNLGNLVVMEQPKERWPVKSLPIRWELVQKDYPTWDDAANMDLPEEIADEYEDIFENAGGTKVGGWPSTIQSEIFWAPFNQHPANPEYVFQIGTETKAHWAWGDGGTGYIGRGTGDARDEWVLAWQCY